ncbi:TetR family transcriptional regulator [Streptomyces sp. Ru73]|uniref:TetR family transcriptional regulator n=1 Tax=Streptomyces sp. Ru73 TaxID=2080748 RepID=UPI000CDDDEE8|nr:TetR family transcriptional regulator [Streptomyces sp. Ru73]POX37368.1 TetR family transcriptional regulator [Streptomyces sp. Ru73]
MSTAQPAPSSARPATLTERRKAATELEIARTAAALFAERGGAVTAEDIARAAGVAPRTFYRYFRTKEDAVAPLLTWGVRSWTERLAELAAREPELPLGEVLERAAREALTPADARAAEALEWTRGLLHAMRDNPALRAVWHRAHHESELALTEVLARAGAAGPLEVRLAAAAADGALRAAVEVWAAGESDEAPAELAVRGLRLVGAGLPWLAQRRGPGAG